MLSNSPLADMIRLKLGKKRVYFREMHYFRHIIADFFKFPSKEHVTTGT